MGETSNKLFHSSIISIQWYRTDELQKRMRRITVYGGSVTRYGPQSVASASGWTTTRELAGN